MTLSEAKELAGVPGLPPRIERIRDRVLAAQKVDQRRPKIKLPRSKRPAAVARNTKRETRREKMAAIRQKVRDDAGGVCELCSRMGSEAHHLVSGPLRRVHEAVQTVLWICRDCHRALHNSDLETLEHAYTYCVGSGMHDAATALAKRIDKAMEARGPTRQEGGTR